MTPNELLASVLQTIPQLVYDDASALGVLLKQAVTVYQENAGVISTLDTDSTTFTKPAFFTRTVSACDSVRRWVAVKEGDTDLTLLVDDRHKGPFTFNYLIKLSEMDFEEDHFPSNVATSILFDYLLALIDIRNNESLRRIYISGTMDTSGLMLPAELKARLDEARAAMKSRRSVLPMVTVY